MGILCPKPQDTNWTNMIKYMIIHIFMITNMIINNDIENINNNTVDNNFEQKK